MRISVWYDIRQAIGDALRELRAGGLADKAGDHPHYISDIERGKRNVAVVNLTTSPGAFGMSAAELLAAANL